MAVSPMRRASSARAEGVKLPSEKVEPVVAAGLDAAGACLGRQTEARITLFCEVVVGSEGRVVWVETTGP